MVPSLERQKCGLKYVMLTFGRSVETLDYNKKRQDQSLAFLENPPQSSFSYHQLFCPTEPVGCGVNESPATTSPASILLQRVVYKNVPRAVGIASHQIRGEGVEGHIAAI